MKKLTLPRSEIRTTKLTVRFSESEYLKLVEIMDKCGHESPSTFLRISGLRSNIPPRMLTPPITNEASQAVKKAVKQLNKLTWLTRPEVEALRTEVYLLSRAIERHRLDMVAMLNAKYAEAIALKQKAHLDDHSPKTGLGGALV